MDANKLNETFMPKELIKKSTLRKSQTLLGTRNGNDFEATTGNAFIRFEPVEVKFNGYELGKPQSISVKILNLAPIPQRVHILPPTEPGFSIKTNKKGSIAAGMSEIIQVNFTSDVHKYQYDVVKVNTETGNFVIPVYAYPSIPKLKEIFPRIVDFGAVTLNANQSNIYPITNPVPLDFPFEFQYVQESPAFIITPIQGVIAANENVNIEITFVPSEKKTYVAEAVLLVKQFDFEPIRIKLMGTGKDGRGAMSSTKRIKSSKLNPLRKTQSKIQVDEQEVELPNVMESNNNTLANQKKSFIRSRTSYPKLLKRNPAGFTQTIVQDEKSIIDIKKEGEKEYLSRFSRIQELDKEKQVKFCQFLGDKKMTEEDLQFELNVIEETRRTKLNNLEDACVTRYANQSNNNGEVEFSKFKQRTLTWDTNKNDELKLRKQKLQLFMNAGSKIIEKYRLEKRLGKIRQFLSNCRTKEDVAKKVSEDYAKSLDAGKNGGQKIVGKLQFVGSFLRPTSFPLQFKEEGEAISKIFETDGKASFDDDMPLDEIKQHETQTMAYQNLTFPSDFSHPKQAIPSYRRSAEEEYPMKSASLENYDVRPASDVYRLPLRIPTHQFIYNDPSFARYKMCEVQDEKSANYLINSTMNNVEDQFQGWSKGQMEVLRAKFLRNPGTEFTTFSSTFNYNEGYEIAYLKDTTSRLPKQIGNQNTTVDDIIEEGDSDEEKLGEVTIIPGQQLLNQIQQKNPKAKERRAQDSLTNFQQSLNKASEKNLNSIKLCMISSPIRKVSELNKWTESRANQFLI